MIAKGRTCGTGKECLVLARKSIFLSKFSMGYIVQKSVGILCLRHNFKFLPCVEKLWKSTGKAGLVDWQGMRG